MNITDSEKSLLAITTPGSSARDTAVQSWLFVHPFVFLRRRFPGFEQGQ
jgi:hypothetical protein